MKPYFYNYIEDKYIYESVVVNPYIPIFLGLDARGGRKLHNRHIHTHLTTTVTLATHMHQGLMKYHPRCTYAPRVNEVSPSLHICTKG